jgi:hypothetical protein
MTSPNITPPRPPERPRTRVALATAALTAAVTVVATAVVSSVVPEMTATTLSAVGHIIGAEQSCGIGGPTRYTEGRAKLNTPGHTVRADESVHIAIPDIDRCHAILATREPDQTFKIHGECTNLSDNPGRFECKLRRTKLCEADTTKLALWMSVFVVDDEGLEKLVAEDILSADESSGYRRFQESLGRDLIGHYKKVEAISVDCRERAS